MVFHVPETFSICSDSGENTNLEGFKCLAFGDVTGLPHSFEFLARNGGLRVYFKMLSTFASSV